MKRIAWSGARRVSRLTRSSLTVGLIFLAPGAARAAAPTSYKIQVVLKAGDPLVGAPFVAGNDIVANALNDRGQLLFYANKPNGVGAWLGEYSGGNLLPIVVPGQHWPGGQWPVGVLPMYPAHINQHGTVVFAAVPGAGSFFVVFPLGTFRWDDQSQQVSVVAQKGMPAVRNLTFYKAGYVAPTINNREEIAFPAWVKSAASGYEAGVFFRGADGQLQPVALPDDPLPGGGTVSYADLPVINDAGLVAFNAVVSGKSGQSAYLWEKGTLSPVLLAGADAPGGGKFTSVDEVWINNKNANALVLAHLSRQPNGLDSLYLWTNGTLKPVAVPGQPMPGGAKLNGIGALQHPTFSLSGRVSFANEAGQHAFVADLADNSTAAYLMDADGTLSLIVRSGAPTDRGTIKRLGSHADQIIGGLSDVSGIALNSLGQVAMGVDLAGDSGALLLLTPGSP